MRRITVLKRGIFLLIFFFLLSGCGYLKGKSPKEVPALTHADFETILKNKLSEIEQCATQVDFMFFLDFVLEHHPDKDPDFGIFVNNQTSPPGCCEFEHPRSRLPVEFALIPAKKRLIDDFPEVHECVIKVLLPELNDFNMQAHETFVHRYITAEGYSMIDAFRKHVPDGTLITHEWKVQ